MPPETLRRRKAEPTFWGDLDAETGDCGLMLLAEEPADKDERGGVGVRKKGKFKRGHRFPSRSMTRQHESSRRCGGQRLEASVSQISTDVLQVLEAAFSCCYI